MLQLLLVDVKDRCTAHDAPLVTRSRPDTGSPASLQHPLPPPEPQQPAVSPSTRSTSPTKSTHRQHPPHGLACGVGPRLALISKDLWVVLAGGDTGGGCFRVHSRLLRRGASVRVIIAIVVLLPSRTDGLIAPCNGRNWVVSSALIRTWVFIAPKLPMTCQPTNAAPRPCRIYG